MESMPLPRTRALTIIAQDPSVKDGGAIVRARARIPAEELRPGPWGYRIHVVDYDVSTDTYYRPRETDLDEDPFVGAEDSQLLADPTFHCQNVYAVVMRTLARFELALGRRVEWGFYGHQLKVVPHAFADANAFYSPDDHALLFGYFPGRNGLVFTCLSHDVVVHETTHALLDGLRERYTDPSSPDQAAFHEGFADVVALLSVFSLRDAVRVIVDLAAPERQSDTVQRRYLTADRLKSSGLLGLAEELGPEITAIRGSALRRSVELSPTTEHYRASEEFMEPHRRGEILVAAMLNSFVEIWAQRLESLGSLRGDRIDRGRVAEEGEAIAERLLTMAIRALDYCPPVDLQFGDFLSALLTADSQVRPDEYPYFLREALLASFRSYGIEPASNEEDGGLWRSAPPNLRYDRAHEEALRRDPDEVFRFIWENRQELALCDDAYTRVLSLRPCLRIGEDGFALRETVAEYLQVLELYAAELGDLGIEKPAGMPDGQLVTLYGGGALIFDEFCRLKFHLHNNVLHERRQSERLAYLWENGFLHRGSAALRRFSNLHRLRATGTSMRRQEVW